MQETWLRFLGQEDPLEKEMATRSTILAWRIPWTEEPDRIHGIARVGHNLVTKSPPLQGIFLTQGLNLHLLHLLNWWVDSLLLVPPGKPSSVQKLSHVRLFATPWTAARQAFLSIANSRSLLKLMSIELVMPSNHLILCRPLQSFPASGSFPMSQFFASGGQRIGTERTMLCCA